MGETIKLTVLPHEGLITEEKAKHFLTVEHNHFLSFASDSLRGDVSPELCEAANELLENVSKLAAACASVLSEGATIAANQDVTLESTAYLAQLAVHTGAEQWAGGFHETALLLGQSLLTRLETAARGGEEEAA